MLEVAWRTGSGLACRPGRMAAGGQYGAARQALGCREEVGQKQPEGLPPTIASPPPWFPAPGKQLLD